MIQLWLPLMLAHSIYLFAHYVKPQTCMHFRSSQWNPLLQIIDSLRKVAIWGDNPDWYAIVYSWIFGLIFLLFGCWFFNRLRPAFADVL